MEIHPLMEPGEAVGSVCSEIPCCNCLGNTSCPAVYGKRELVKRCVQKTVVFEMSFSSSSFPHIYFFYYKKSYRNP